MKATIVDWSDNVIDQDVMDMLFDYVIGLGERRGPLISPDGTSAIVGIGTLISYLLYDYKLLENYETMAEDYELKLQLANEKIMQYQRMTDYIFD